MIDRYTTGVFDDTITKFSDIPFWERCHDLYAFQDYKGSFVPKKKFPSYEHYEYRINQNYSNIFRVYVFGFLLSDVY
jgi:hypothetical protein